MSADRLGEMVWPSERLGEAIDALARRTGFAARSSGPAWRGGATLDACETDPNEEKVEMLAARAGFVAEPVAGPRGEARRMVIGAAPAIVRLAGAGSTGYLAILGRRRGGLRALCPDLAARSIGPNEVLEAIRQAPSSEQAREAERVLDRAGLSATRRAAAREALLSEMLAGERTGDVWVLRPRASAGIRAQAREGRLGRLLAALLAAHALVFALWIVSWWLLGRAALEGRLDQGWLLGWGLLLLTLIPFHLASSLAAGIFSIRAGAILKRRLLQGAFGLEPETVRREGAGGLLGRVIEAEEVERLALAGGFLAATGLIEVLLAGFVLARGAGGALHLVLLALTLAAAAWLAAAYRRRRAEWTERRFAMTNDLVERMVGHRTRLAQEAPSRWNAGEDAAAALYVDASRRLDSAGARLSVLVPRGWFVAGILGLGPAFVAGDASQAALAVGIGGILLAYHALRHVADGLERCAAVHIAWRQVAPFWKAAALESPPGSASLALRAASPTSAAENGPPFLDLRDVTFQYPGRSEPVLRSLDFAFRDSERVLLEGPSGGGKSTLGSLLSGTRTPEAGLVLLRGLDRETLGRDAWRRRVVLVPQFHDNHVFLGSFAFNALMGRAWPPAPEDIQEAEDVARALGLGPLLERMPAGMLQLVGETGWQLSHGERSRLYIARALLQRPEAMVLDESFAALDPETLKRTLEYVLERAKTLMVIAHP